MIHDETYLGLLRKVLQEGKPKKNRTGVDTIGVFGAQARLTRAPFASPYVTLNLAKTDLLSFNFDDIQLVDYSSHPTIKAEVAV